MRFLKRLERLADEGVKIGVSVGATHVHDVSREVFDALPSPTDAETEFREPDGRRWWSKNVTRRSSAFTREPPAQLVANVVLLAPERGEQKRMKALPDGSLVEREA